MGINEIKKVEDKEKNKSDLFPLEVKSVFPKRRQDVLNINGWGFVDSYFDFIGGYLTFKGER